MDFLINIFRKIADSRYINTINSADSTNCDTGDNICRDIQN